MKILLSFKVLSYDPVPVVERDERERLAAEKREAELRARLDVPEPGSYPHRPRSPVPMEREKQQPMHTTPLGKSPRRDRLKDTSQRSLSPIEMR